MKEFNNKTEREFLRVLLKMDEKIEVNLGDYLSQCVLNNDRLIQLDNKKIVLFFNIKKETELTFVKDLSAIISLIEILKDEKLIFTHINPEILNNKLNTSKTEPTPKQITEKGGVEVLAITNDKYIQEKLLRNLTAYGKWELPTTLSGYILEYIDQFCYVRPELTEYINNNFSTPEQIRFKTTLLWTRIATFFAFLGLLIAITIPFLTKPCIDKHKMSNKNMKTKEIINETILDKHLDTKGIKKELE